MRRRKLINILVVGIALTVAVQSIPATAVTTNIGVGPGSPGQHVIASPKNLVPLSSLNISDKEYSDIKITNSEDRNLQFNSVAENGEIYDTEDHSIDEVVKKWNEINPSHITNATVYSETPSIQGDYSHGEVDKSYLNYCDNYLNFIRYLTYLPKIKLDDNLNLTEQYGAVLLGKVNILSHSNDKPSDMSDEFYDTALNATMSSNLSSGSSIINGINGWVDDTYNVSGYGSIGHRLALLDSNLEYTGFGSYGEYSLAYVRTNTYSNNDKSDRAIFRNNPSPRYKSWPSKGAFPSSLINTDTIWSIQLNDYDYNNSSANKEELAMANASVKITRLSDGRTWDLPRVDYFNRSKNGFNQNGAVEFHIASNDLGASSYTGKYKVELNNVKKRNGKFENITYTIDFFDLK